MNNKTKLYLISGSLIIGILLLLFGINYITSQKNTKKPVKPIASSSEVTLAEVPTTVVNTNKGISVSKTIKEISSSSSKSTSSKSQKSSSSSESSSSQVSSSSVDTNAELDSRLQWKEDCQTIAARVPQNSKVVYDIDKNKKVIVAPCGLAPYGIQHLIYYYEIDSTGRWISQRQVFGNENEPQILLGEEPKFNTSNLVLTSFGRVDGGIDCGILKTYKFDINSKSFSFISSEIKKECQ